MSGSVQCVVKKDPTYCHYYELRYSVITATDNDALNETNEKHEVAIASADSLSRDIAVGFLGTILGDIEVNNSTASDESNSEESNKSPLIYQIALISHLYHTKYFIILNINTDSMDPL